MTTKTQRRRKRKSGDVVGKRPNRSGDALHVYINPQLRAALAKYAEEAVPRVSLTASVEAALAEYLKSKGYWPPSPPSPDASKPPEGQPGA